MIIPLVSTSSLGAIPSLPYTKSLFFFTFKFNFLLVSTLPNSVNKHWRFSAESATTTVSSANNSWSRRYSLRFRSVNLTLPPCALSYTSPNTSFMEILGNYGNIPHTCIINFFFLKQLLTFQTTLIQALLSLKKFSMIAKTFSSTSQTSFTF